MLGYTYGAFFMLAFVVRQFVLKDEYGVHENTAKPYRASEHLELENPSAYTNPQSALLSCNLQDG